MRQSTNDDHDDHDPYWSDLMMQVKEIDVPVEYLDEEGQDIRILSGMASSAAKGKNKAKKIKPSRVLPMNSNSNLSDDEREDFEDVVHEREAQVAVNHMRQQLLEAHVKLKQSTTKSRQLRDKLSQLGKQYRDQTSVREQLEGQLFQQQMARFQHPSMASTMRTVNSTDEKRQNQKQHQHDLLFQLILRRHDDVVEFTSVDDDDASPGPSSFASSSWHKPSSFMFFQSQIRQVDSQFGHSVGSYFKFFRFMLLLHLVLCTLLSGFALRHVYEQLVVLKKTNVVHVFNFVTLGSNHALEVAWMVFLTPGVFCLVTVLKWTKEDRRAKIHQGLDREDGHTCSQLVLNAWDFASTGVSFETGRDVRKNLAQELAMVYYSSSKSPGSRRLQSHVPAIIRTLRRVLSTILYLCIQCTSWCVILLLTTRARALEDFVSSRVSSVLAPYAASVVPASVTIINAIMPTLLNLLTKFEQWQDPGFALKIRILRLFLAKMTNVLLQIFSYTLLLDPYMFTENPDDLLGSIRENVAQTFRPDIYRCRAEQTSFGLMMLVATEFTVSKILQLGQYFVYQCSSSSKKPQFQVASKMVSLLYFQTLMMMAFPLAPFSLLSSTLMLAVNFKFDLWFLMKYQQKPTVPWNAADAGRFFCKFYFIITALFLLTSHWFLVNPRLPKSCAIQDHAIALCSQVLDPGEVCHTWDTSNAKSSYFQKVENCPEGYPSCVCAGSLSCGPFVNYRNAYEPMLKAFSKVAIVGPFLDFILTNLSIGLFCITIATILVARFRGNSLLAHQMIHHKKQRYYQSEIRILDHKLNTAQKKLHQLEKIN